MRIYCYKKINTFTNTTISTTILLRLNYNTQEMFVCVCWVGDLSGSSSIKHPDDATLMLYIDTIVFETGNPGVPGSSPHSDLLIGLFCKYSLSGLWFDGFNLWYYLYLYLPSRKINLSNMYDYLIGLPHIHSTIV